MMRTDSFMFANRTHWIAAYNFKDGVPVENGDERVIMIHVPVLFDDEKDDWDEVMCPALETERSDFLGALWQMELPPSAGRSVSSGAFNVSQGGCHGSRPRNGEADL